MPEYDTTYWIEVLLTGSASDNGSWVRLYFIRGPAVITSLSNFKNNAILLNWQHASNAWDYEGADWLCEMFLA